MENLRIRGARTHNLKNIDLDLPRNRLIVFTGLSGSGKSSLAFDTIYAESQRRYVESLSAYARQFLAVMDKPDVDHMTGLSPAICIEQKATSHNPRSTVGTITEIHDHLRLLFARAGVPHCPTHNLPLHAQTVSQMVDYILGLDTTRRWMVLAPLIKQCPGAHHDVLDSLRSQGYLRARINGAPVDLDNTPALDPEAAHSIEAVVDRFKIRPGLQQRLAESLETALELGQQIVIVADMDGAAAQPDHRLSAQHACPECNFSLPELEPRIFSFNSPHGACPHCNGLGRISRFDAGNVVTDGTLSLAVGAIRGWDQHNPFYWRMIRALAEHYGFNPDTPFNQLDAQARHVVLHGSGDDEILSRYESGQGAKYQRKHRFEGILPNMARRYRDTESPTVRAELNKYRTTHRCPHCAGSRLADGPRNVRLSGKNIADLSAQSVGALHHTLQSLRPDGAAGHIADKILNEIHARLSFLVDMGLTYLTLERSADTLSGGEAQRIRLASQIGAGLVGVLYVLDEPSIGLHQRDHQRLLNALTRLRDLGNTVIVVEHDEDTIRSADHIVDIGPRAGEHGGRILASGTLDTLRDCPQSLTGDYLAGRRAIAIPARKAINPDRMLKLTGARGNNLRQLSVAIPLGVLTCVTGVSGSGKSTLINDTLSAAVAQTLHGSRQQPAPYDTLTGADRLDRVIRIDQTPIGRTPRSNPATYTGLFGPIRELFASTPEARSRGYTAGRFSFNVKGGRCEACQGDGLIKVEMHFLPDVYVTCDACAGKRYNRETLDIRYKGLTIAEVLDLTVEHALNLFEPVMAVHRKLAALNNVGLGYLRLGQSATTVSGGEAQRVKLAKELSKPSAGNTLYVLDEPTTGLHIHDIQQLLTVLRQLRDRGNTIVIIEHHLDVIKTADWLIDLGPDGGDQGGQILATGTPESVAEHPDSHTGRFLASLLTNTPASNKP